jgi:hypothetical protein
MCEGKAGVEGRYGEHPVRTHAVCMNDLQLIANGGLVVVSRPYGLGQS